MSNNQSPSHLIAYSLAAICFGKDVELPYKHKQIEIDTSIYSKYIGDYENIRILEKNNKLYYLDYEIEMVPESQTKFFRLDDNNRTIEFIENKKGKIVHLIVTKAGIKEIKNRKN